MKRALCLLPVALAIIVMTLPSFAEEEIATAPGETKIHVRSVNECEEIRFQAFFYASDSTLIVSIDNNLTPNTITLTAESFEGIVECLEDEALLEIEVVHDGGTATSTSCHGTRILKDKHNVKVLTISKEE